jgi:hypothetical protein
MYVLRMHGKKVVGYCLSCEAVNVTYVWPELSYIIIEEFPVANG